MPANPPRNLLVILCDQLRRDALGCYGDANVATPNIDRMAQRGVRFNCANSTYPICVPFRFSMMTGEYAHTRMAPGIEWRMSPAERTLADEFNDAGHETIYVGKWHLYGNHLHMPGYSAERVNREPVPRLFQGRWKHWRGFELRNKPFDTCYFVDDDPTPRMIDGYQTDGLFDIAMGEMRAQREAGKAFSCVLSVEPPHPPYEAPPELERQWEGRDIALPPNFDPADDEQREKYLHRRRIYYAMIENLDQNVGRMLSFLDEQQLADDTAVMFLSDHGEMDGSHGCQGKQRPYEESVGIPLIVMDPASNGNEDGQGSGQGGRTIDAPFATEDLFPTLLGLVGLSPRNTLPGRDFTPLIRGNSSSIDRDGVLLEFVSEIRPRALYNQQTWRGWRTQRCKYIVMGDLHGAEPWAFFDLEDDPCELQNRVDDPAYADLVAAHHRALRDRLIETTDNFPLKPAFGCDGLNMFGQVRQPTKA